MRYYYNEKQLRLIFVLKDGEILLTNPFLEIKEIGRIVLRYKNLAGKIRSPLFIDFQYIIFIRYCC